MESGPAAARAPTILITGCSTGIGHHCAHALKARGWRVFASARNAEDRDMLTGEGLESLVLDYDDSGSIAAAVDQVLGLTGGRLDALYNNGGFAQAGALEDLSTDLLRAQFETNFFGWHDLTRRIIPVMRKQRSGRIVFCSSVLGFLSVRFRGAYAASKHAVEAMADTLRIELHGSGIHVSLIEPGPVRSAIVKNALDEIEDDLDLTGSVHREGYEKQLARRHGLDHMPFKVGPEAVLTRLVLALESQSPKARYRITVPAHAAWGLKRILPVAIADWLLRKVP